MVILLVIRMNVVDSWEAVGPWYPDVCVCVFPFATNDTSKMGALRKGVGGGMIVSGKVVMVEIVIRDV